MAFMPFLVPPSSLAPPVSVIDQTPANNTALWRFASYAKTVDFKATGNELIFTTALNRGRFFPIAIAAAALRADGGGLNPPTINIGFTAPNYNDWISGSTLIRVATGTFGSGNFNADLTILENATSLSAGPGTSIYLRKVAPPSDASNDYRTINILGVYLA